jgi:RNA polymerase sigma-70 factor (ECF subfamily)
VESNPLQATMNHDERFAEALREHGDALFRVCCAHARHETERRDLYQEVLIRMWRGLRDFRGQSALSTWLYRVAVNTCLTWRRGETRRAERTRPVDNESLKRLPARETASLATSENLARLYACIAKLGALDRVLVALYLEDLGAAHIGEVIGLSEGNVRVRLHRAKERLTELWEETGDEPR